MHLLLEIDVFFKFDLNLFKFLGNSEQQVVYMIHSSIFNYMWDGVRRAHTHIPSASVTLRKVKVSPRRGWVYSHF